MSMFYLRNPNFQCFLKEGTIEYHIFYDRDYLNDFFFPETYRSVTNNEFMDDVYDYLLETFEDKLIEHGTDTDYSEDGNEMYIWIHMNKESAEQDVKDILDALEVQYKTKWCMQRIPTLLKHVRIALCDKKVLAYAVSDFQRRRGVDETHNILFILFNQIW